MLVFITNAVVLWALVMVAALPLYFGLRRVAPNLPPLQWWTLALGVMSVFAVAFWGPRAGYFSGYVVACLLMLGIPTLIASFLMRKPKPPGSAGKS